jgi:hypothetical protein
LKLFKRRNKAFKVCILFSNFLRYIQLVPLRSKENVSLFSKISLRSFLHMCETKIYSMNTTPRALRRPRLNARRQHHRLSRFLRAR